MVAFEIGPFSIAYYGIMLATGLASLVALGYLEAKRRCDDTRHIFNILVISVPMGIIGARLYHVIDQWSYYSQHPADIFGGAGLGIFGAIIGSVVGLVVYTQWRRLSTLHWLDIFAPGTILGQAIGRWGNYFNQELYGYPADLPWAIYIDPEHRLAGYENYSHFHPLFFYEFLWNLSGCILLLFIGRKFKHHLLKGDIFFLYIIFYSIGRFYLEGLKIDVWTIGGFPTARWISGGAIIIFSAIIAYRHFHQRGTPSPEG